MPLHEILHLQCNISCFFLNKKLKFERLAYNGDEFCNVASNFAY